MPVIVAAVFTMPLSAPANPGAMSNRLVVQPGTASADSPTDRLRRVTAVAVDVLR